MRQLLLHPDQAAEVRDNPALTKRAVEEGLRRSTSVYGVPRLMTRPVTLSGVGIPDNATLFVHYAAAQRHETSVTRAGRDDDGHIPPCPRLPDSNHGTPPTSPSVDSAESPPWAPMHPHVTPVGMWWHSPSRSASTSPDATSRIARSSATWPAPPEPQSSSTTWPAATPGDAVHRNPRSRRDHHRSPCADPYLPRSGHRLAPRRITRSRENPGPRRCELGGKRSNTAATPRSWWCESVLRRFAGAREPGGPTAGVTHRLHALLPSRSPLILEGSPPDLPVGPSRRAARATYVQHKSTVNFLANAARPALSTANRGPPRTRSGRAAAPPALARVAQTLHAARKRALPRLRHDHQPCLCSRAHAASDAKT
jgi:hypothetical protein